MNFILGSRSLPKICAIENEKILFVLFLVSISQLAFSQLRKANFLYREYSLSLGGTIRIPTNKKSFKRLGLDLSVGAKYYT